MPRVASCPTASRTTSHPEAEDADREYPTRAGGLLPRFCHSRSPSVSPNRVFGPCLPGAPSCDDQTIRKSLLVAAATMIAAALLVWGARVLEPSSALFAILVVWVPMTWLGTVSRVVQPRLPRSYHDLRDFERDGRLYERLGVRLVKRLLRRGPLAVFNPDLHLPAERSRERLAHLDQRMRDAEASHLILLVATSGVVVHAVARGWWAAALLTLLFDVLLNGYPVMLQRYNRALLCRRFPIPVDEGNPTSSSKSATRTRPAPTSSSRQVRFRLSNYDALADRARRARWRRMTRRSSSDRPPQMPES